MRFWRHYVIGLVCLAMGFLVLCQPLPTQAQGAAPPQGRPALYEFGARWCIPCKEMQQVMADLKQQYGDQMEVRMVYVDEQKPLFEQYKIMLIPTQVFMDAQGKEVDRHIGALPKEEVIKKLKELNFIR
jgi:thioredoxin 1